MRKGRFIAAVCLLLALPLTGCSAGTQTAETVERIGAGAASARVREGDPGAVRLFAVSVGKGDALVLRVGSWMGLIDTGKPWARGRVERALSLLSADLPTEGGGHLDAVFLTHTDGDHAGGLRWLAASGCAVDRVYASAMYAGVKENKHPAVAAARALTPSEGVQWLRRGDRIPLGDTGAALRVLAPASWHEDEDDNSLVLMLESPHGRLLLPGDMEYPEEAELLSFGDDLRCEVLKVPNHADDDTASAALINACAARIAVISTDSAEKPGTPDPGVLRRLAAAGTEALVTQDAELGVLVTLEGGDVAAAYVDIDAPPTQGLSLAAADPADDTVTLFNRGGDGIDLGGCYLCTDREDALFAFPDGTVIGPGGALTVGTRATGGAYDVLWDEKRALSRKKSDAVSLYDPWGRLIDRKETSAGK